MNLIDLRKINVKANRITKIMLQEEAKRMKLKKYSLKDKESLRKFLMRAKRKIEKICNV